MRGKAKRVEARAEREVPPGSNIPVMPPRSPLPLWLQGSLALFVTAAVALVVFLVSLVGVVTWNKKPTPTNTVGSQTINATAGNRDTQNDGTSVVLPDVSGNVSKVDDPPRREANQPSRQQHDGVAVSQAIKDKTDKDRRDNDRRAEEELKRDKERKREEKRKPDEDSKRVMEHKLREEEFRLREDKGSKVSAVKVQKEINEIRSSINAVTDQLKRPDTSKSERKAIESKLRELDMRLKAKERMLTKPVKD